MSETKYYDVEQTRKIRVWSNDEAGALVLAKSAFTHGLTSIGNLKVYPEGFVGNATTRVEVVEVKIRKA